VQSLIDSKWLTFQEQKPSVEQNPLSGHTSSTVNAIMKEGGPILVRSIHEMKKHIPLMSVLSLKSFCKT